jgi:hypothetical protein
LLILLKLHWLRLLSLLILFYWYGTLQAQHYAYVHYDEKDGLSGSTVYDMCQDKDGFIWFATESGLSRYDGTRFKNFTTKDGLPDNELLKLHADSKGRIWASTFNHQLTYYYKGKIYNKYNDSLLKKAITEKFVYTFIESRAGTIYCTDGLFLYGISPSNQFSRYDSGQFKGTVNFIDSNGIHRKFGFLSMRTFDVYYHNETTNRFDIKGNLMHDYGLKSRKGLDTFFVESAITKVGQFTKLVKKKKGTMDGGYINGKLAWCITHDGAWLYDTLTHDWTNFFLPNKVLSRLLIDTEQNIWFSTLGEGVYKLPSKSFVTYKTWGEDLTKGNEVYAFGSHAGQIIAGTGYSKALWLNNGAIAGQLNYEGERKKSPNPYRNNRLYAIQTLPNGTTLLGFDAFLAKLENKRPSFSPIFPIKAIEVIDNEQVLIGSASHTVRIRVSDLSIIDTIWHERCTRLLYANDKYYIGTVKGLYEVDRDKHSRYLGAAHRSLAKRITGLAKDDVGRIWVATSDAGILAYRNGAVEYTISESNGLPSDICKTLFWRSPFLWVGTNKGISKINTQQPNAPVVNYSVSDGLASNFINAIYVQDSIVYTGTPAGVTLFNENAVMSNSICKLHLLGVTIGGRDTAIADSYQLPWRLNNIGFDFVAVSFKSAGDIVYQYKLQGLNTDWQTTRNTNINYPSLPAGDYIFLLQAVNKFGVKSDTIRIPFSIAAPLWKKWWFFLLLSGLAVALALWWMDRRNKATQQRLEERNRTQKQFAELEQQALQAQMNPHFVFNCLNSIQQFIVLADIPAANKYLTAFARLIRQTLDNSAKKMLSIEEELSYLASYLELEKMRFGNRFTYVLWASDDIDKGNDGLPAMLVQPFVENSIRHGLAYMKAAQGILQVVFTKQGDSIVCTITDNGIGRAEAAKRKSVAHIEYQSKGMSLTQKRIDLLNRSNQINIQVTIKDLYHPGTPPLAAGTEVTLIIPQ